MITDRNWEVTPIPIHGHGHVNGYQSAEVLKQNIFVLGERCLALLHTHQHLLLFHYLEYCNLAGDGLAAKCSGGTTL